MPDKGQVLVSLCLSIAVLLVAPAVQGAEACFNESCGTTCTPDLPVEISPLIEDSDFPPQADTPIAFVDPGDGRGKYLVATQEGAILVWDSEREIIQPEFFLDLRDDNGGPVLAGGERGLLALVLDPDYVNNGRLYVFYTRAGSGSEVGDVVIARYERLSADVGDPNSGTTLLVIDHPASNHNGGWLAFGPDNFLYIATGDGGGFCDGNQGNNGDGQSVDSLAGKMLRIDVLGTDPGGTPPDDCGIETGPYTIPTSNPFAGQEPACDEIWSLGLRNPFRFSFDRMTGDMYIGDVGQDRWEEINLQAAVTPAPVNFGWVCREGCETANNSGSGCSTAGCPVDTGTTCEFPRSGSDYWDPVLCHFNGPWASIIGGYRYRGSNVPSIAGDYIYSDAFCGQLWKTTELDPANPAAIDAECWASGFGGTVSFAEDSLGELYILNGFSSRVDCIHNGNGCTWVAPIPEIFADGFESGDTSAWN